MNSGQDAQPDLPDADAADVDPDNDKDNDSESLQRSRDAIDEGREAAREALKDEGGLTSGVPEQPPGTEEDAPN